MSHTLHIFNPWHDEALAANVQYYSPSLAGRKLACALSELPRVWGKDEDEYLKIPESGRVKDLVPPDWSKIQHIAPWGWDNHVVEIFQRLGAPESLLPTEEQLRVMRHLSSRANVSEMMKYDTQHPTKNEQHLAQNTQPLLSKLPGVTPFSSFFCTTMTEVVDALSALGGYAMLKSPWSSSGRGVFPVKKVLDKSTKEFLDKVAEARVQKILQQQGGIEVQSLHEVLGNFAFEYHALPDGTVEYDGLSLFHAAPGGAYLGNLVAHPQKMERELCRWMAPHAVEWGISEENIPQLLHQLRSILAELLAKWLQARYVGPLGVDLLITPTGIHPCVEINLRRTMGHVAVNLGKQQTPNAPLQLLQISLEGWQLVPLSSPESLG